MGNRGTTTGQNSHGVADLLYTKWVALYGCPLVLHSDRGGEFRAEVISHLCDVLRVTKTYTSPYRPQSDGMAERSMRTLQAMLRAFVKQRPRRLGWPFTGRVLRVSLNTTCLHRGFAVQNGFWARDYPPNRLATRRWNARARIPKCPVQYVEWLKETLYLGHDVARRKLQKAAERQRKGYQEKCRTVSFKRGYGRSIRSSMLANCTRKIRVLSW